jgi:predicted PhzF superfamily epimerase YddE/YHI9
MSDEQAVRAFVPNIPDLTRAKADLIITARGTACDFVSRVFAPWAGIPEGPVTGSIHTLLTPYWARRLRKRALAARQLSARGGELACEDRGARVAIGGSAVLAVSGTLQLP